MSNNLVWEQQGHKKVAQYKGFTLTQIGHRVSIKDDLDIIPDPGFHSLAGALAYVDSIHKSRNQPQDLYSLGCCDDMD